MSWFCMYICLTSLIIRILLEYLFRGFKYESLLWYLGLSHIINVKFHIVMRDETSQEHIRRMKIVLGGVAPESFDWNKYEAIDALLAAVDDAREIISFKPIFAKRASSSINYNVHTRGL